jgi:hypothetical protein
MRIRASGWSSTTSTRTRAAGTPPLQGELGGAGDWRPREARLQRRRTDVEGQPHFGDHSALGVPLEGEPLRAAIELLEAGAGVPNPDAGASRRRRYGRLEWRIVDHAEHERVAVPRAFHRDVSALRPPLDAMLHGVLDQRLEDERRHERVEHVVVDLHVDREPILEAHLHDVDVEIEQRELASQRHLGLAAPLEAVAQQIAEPRDHATHAARVALDERRDGVQGVEQEVRVELTTQGVEPRFGELTGELDRLFAPRPESQRVRAGHAGRGDAEREDERVEKGEPQRRSAAAASAAPSTPHRHVDQRVTQLVADEGDQRRRQDGRGDDEQRSGHPAPTGSLAVEVDTSDDGEDDRREDRPAERLDAGDDRALAQRAGRPTAPRIEDPIGESEHLVADPEGDDGRHLARSRQEPDRSPLAIRLGYGMAAGGFHDTKVGRVRYGAQRARMPFVTRWCRS